MWTIISSQLHFKCQKHDKACDKCADFNSVPSHLFNSLPRQTKKETSKLCIIGPLWGESTADQWFSPHVSPVMWKAFPCHDVILISHFISRLDLVLMGKCEPLYIGFQFPVAKFIVIPSLLSQKKSPGTIRAMQAYDIWAIWFTLHYKSTAIYILHSRVYTVKPLL